MFFLIKYWIKYLAKLEKSSTFANSNFGDIAD